MLIQKNILLQLDKDTDPSFQKVEAPLIKKHPMVGLNAKIIGYKKSLIIENHYELEKINDCYIVNKTRITEERRARINLDNELVIIKQNCVTNENKMVCIHKENYMSFH